MLSVQTFSVPLLRFPSRTRRGSRNWPAARVGAARLVAAEDVFSPAFARDVDPGVGSAASIVFDSISIAVVGADDEIPHSPPL